MKFNLMAVTLVSVAMAACGGGGDDSQSAGPSPAQGLWLGSTANGRTVTGLVLSDGTYYVLYSRVGNAGVLGGVVQGTSSASGGTWSSSDARDFNIEGVQVLSATLTGSYSTKQTLSGTVGYSSGTSTAFSANYSNAYESAPSLSAVSGSYSGNIALSQGVQGASVAVSTSGAITASANGCSATGTAAPRSDGNAFNIAITFGSSPCFFAGQTFTGIAYYDAATKRLYAAAPNAARTDGVLFIGTKP